MDLVSSDMLLNNKNRSDVRILDRLIDVRSIYIDRFVYGTTWTPRCTWLTVIKGWIIYQSGDPLCRVLWEERDGSFAVEFRWCSLINRLSSTFDWCIFNEGEVMGWRVERFFPRGFAFVAMLEFEMRTAFRISCIGLKNCLLSIKKMPQNT